MQPGGRSGLFEQPEAAVFGATFAWLTGIDWASGPLHPATGNILDDLLDDYLSTFALPASAVEGLQGAPHRVADVHPASHRTSTQAWSATSTTLLELLGVLELGHRPTK